jgi:hypothetical protein
MKNIEGLLRALEDQFWKGGSKFYENSLTDASLMVFAEPVGVLENLRLSGQLQKAKGGLRLVLGICVQWS